MALRTEKFQKAWNMWVKHRNEIGKPLQPTQVEAQLERLSARGEKGAVEIIMHTVGQGWQGMREPEKENGQKDTTMQDIRERAKAIFPDEPGGA